MSALLSDIWPRDSMALFEGIAPSFVAAPIAATGGIVAAANNDRIALLISCAAAPPASVTLFPGPVPDPNAGWPTNAQAGAMLLTWHDHGPLVTAQWFGLAIGGAPLNIMVVQVIQQRNPRSYGWNIYAQPGQPTDQSNSGGDFGASPGVQPPAPSLGFLFGPGAADYSELWRRRCSRFRRQNSLSWRG